MSFVSEMPDTPNDAPKTFMESDDRDILIEKMRANINLMSRLMAETEKEGQKKKKNPRGSGYFIDGTVLSTVFSVVLLSIISVSVYAFYNLFIAILKKFPSRHTEL
uniref:Uncharacterized protein n=1 Tax=Clastoptera arizonana TaxID=38151 RepID=A0A1B6DJZ9_9HEMI